MPTSQCVFEGCHRPIHAVTTKLCNGHQKQKREGIELRPIRKWAYAPEVCIVEGCERRPQAHGWCQMHRQRVDATGDPGVPEKVGKPSFWHKNKGGYVVRKAVVDGKIVLLLQHRVIMEEHLGRKLLPHENIHHINGQRDDNKIKNLEIWSVSQPAGQRVEDKIAWAKEFLEQYGYVVDLG